MATGDGGRRIYVWQTPPPSHPLLRSRYFRPLHILNAWFAEWSYPRGYSGPVITGRAPHPGELAKVWVHRQRHYGAAVDTHGTHWGGLYVAGLGVGPERDDYGIWSPSGTIRGLHGSLLLNPDDAVDVSASDPPPVIPGSGPDARVEWLRHVIFNAAGRARIRPWVEAFARALPSECAAAGVPLPEALIWDHEDSLLPWWAVRRNSAEYGGVQTGNLQAQMTDKRADTEIIARNRTLRGLYDAEPFPYAGHEWHLSPGSWLVWASWINEAASEAVYETMLEPIARACGGIPTSNWMHFAARPGRHFDYGNMYELFRVAPTYRRESMNTIYAYPVVRYRQADPDSPGLSAFAAHHAANLDAVDDPHNVMLWQSVHGWGGYRNEWSNSDPPHIIPTREDYDAFIRYAADRGVRTAAMWFEDPRGWDHEPWQQAAELLESWERAWDDTPPPPPPPPPPPGGRRLLVPGDVVYYRDPRIQREFCYRLTDEVRRLGEIPPDEQVDDDPDFGRCDGTGYSRVKPSGCEANECCPRSSFTIGTPCSCFTDPPKGVEHVMRTDLLESVLAQARSSCVVALIDGKGTCVSFSLRGRGVNLPDPPGEPGYVVVLPTQVVATECCGCCPDCGSFRYEPGQAQRWCDQIEREIEWCRKQHPNATIQRVLICQSPDPNQTCCWANEDRFCRTEYTRVEYHYSDQFSSDQSLYEEWFPWNDEECVGVGSGGEMRRWRRRLTRNGEVVYDIIEDRMLGVYICGAHVPHPSWCQNSGATIESQHVLSCNQGVFEWRHFSTWRDPDPPHRARFSYSVHHLCRWRVEPSGAPCSGGCDHPITGVLRTVPAPPATPLAALMEGGG